MNDQADTVGMQGGPTDAVSLLVAHGLTKKYHGRTVVDRVDLRVRTGEVKAIIGPSGSGKSTVLRLIALLEHADGGEIWLDGRRIGSIDGRDGQPVHLSEKQLVKHRRGIGMVFQRFNLFPHLNAMENVALALRTALRKPKSDAFEQASDMLGRVGLSHRERAFPSELSGGEQQRVAIARALVLNPSLLLFDEPTSALDPELVKSVLDVMTSLAESGMTMVVVTHEIGFARSVADRVVMFDNATIVEEGPPAEVLSGANSERTRAFLQHLL
jgi:polar amino acid transport system ATP-binding protein